MNGIDIIQTEFQYYPAKIYLTEPLGVITLEQLLLSIKDPGSKLRKVFKQIRKATEDGNRELKDKLKDYAKIAHEQFDNAFTEIVNRMHNIASVDNAMYDMEQKHKIKTLTKPNDDQK